jgi:hypothetical protein
MKLQSNFVPFSMNYPPKATLPENLLPKISFKLFKSKSRLIPFTEQFLNEQTSHLIRHIHYEHGTINQKPALCFYWKKQPIKLVYKSEGDSLSTYLMGNNPPKTKFPPTTVSPPIARTLREVGLKWVVDQFFSHFNYVVFDEPQLEEVTPDLLVFPAVEAGKLLNSTVNLNSKDRSKSNGSFVDIDLKRAIFIELKAFHQSTLVGEKEVLQTFNYAQKGGKALLITTGTFGNLNCFSLLNTVLAQPSNGSCVPANHSTASTNQNESSPDIKTENSVMEESEESENPPSSRFSHFISAVKSKFKGLVKTLDMTQSQDMYDTRGIYISASTKLNKLFRYADQWGHSVDFRMLTTPAEIVGFLKSSESLGLVDPDAFYALLLEQSLNSAAELFQQIRSRWLEEIVINPTLLYPK